MGLIFHVYQKLRLNENDASCTASAGSSGEP